ncbi:MAG: DedA family protein [Betaproteobacteria bacterium]|nr:DedA family protein [Betaproteobacteria bacterium]MBI2509115.1 DedA family protein [Betaproteobacteria bacterium]
MELFATFADIVLHLDRHLQWLVANYGVWIYAILFLIIFCETGLVVTPFLPGDSLLFVAGTLAAAGDMYVHGLFAALATASFAGDNTNYWVGRCVGPRVFTREKSLLFDPEHLARTQRFYEKFGAKTVFFARFVPIIRTFAPFVAGIGRMRYGRFLFYSLSGSVAWVGSLTYAGYHFGNVPVVKQNLSLVIVVIILLSISPGLVEYLRHRRKPVTGDR